MPFSIEIPSTLGTTLFSIDEQNLVYGKTVMPLSTITGFSYGEEKIDVYRPGTNRKTGCNTHYEFFIYDSSGRWICINFIAHYISPAKNMLLFSELERKIWHYIGYPLLHQMENELLERGTCTLAGCTLGREGIVISRRLLFFRIKTLIPWRDLLVDPREQVMILKNEKRRTHKQKFDLIHHVNARVLKDLLYKILGDADFRKAVTAQTREYTKQFP